MRIAKVEGLTLWVEPYREIFRRASCQLRSIVVVIVLLMHLQRPEGAERIRARRDVHLRAVHRHQGPGHHHRDCRSASSMRRVDLRVIVLNVPKQDVITRDNVSVKVNAVVYFRVVDPGKAIIQVANPYEATSQVAQTTLRSVLGQHEMDDLLSQRDKLNADIQTILDQNTENWGIKVANVEIKDVDLDESMIRAMAKQAEAERTRRAKIIHAEGEAQAAQTARRRPRNRWRSSPAPCSCAICRRWRTSRTSARRSSCSRCRSI